MTDYLNENTDNNFENFMKEMWHRDYEIMQMSKKKDSSCFRSYSGWNDLFNKIIIDKNNANIEKLLE